MSRRSIAVVIHDGVQALDVAGPLDVFAEANGFVLPENAYDITVVGQATHPIRASNGMVMMPNLSFGEANRLFQTVLVAGGPTLPDMARDEEMSEWLRKWGAKAERFGSICTGAFALGRAGLLDGRVVTTHWENSEKLASMFPGANVVADRIFLRDGSMVTSAGVTAGIDLALALVAEDHGPAVSLACARRLVVVAQRQGGQSQFSPHLLPQSPTGSPLARVQSYVQKHIREAFPVDRLAEIAGMSPRSIARLFANELASTPHEFVESVRIDHARNLLQATDLPLKVVAFDCGFGSSEQMRQVFRRRLATSPAMYRRSFQRKDKLGA